MSERIKTLESGSKVGTLNTSKGLKELAALSGGLKAHNTFVSLEGQEAVRKCCGGNGYLLNSGIAKQAADSLWTVTAEGDYTIMMLFSAKFLLKSIMSVVKQGTHVDESVEYLNDLTKIPNLKELFNGSSQHGMPERYAPEAASADDFYNPEFLLKLFRYRALDAVTNMATSVEYFLKHGDK